MKPELQRLYDYFIIDRTHRALRVPCEVDFAALFSRESLSGEERMCRRFERLCELERPIIKPFEKIGKFIFLDKPFEVGVELSPKQGIIRYKINELYKAKISLMYADSGLQAMLGSVLTSEALTNIQKNVQKKVQDLKKQTEQILK